MTQLTTSPTHFAPTTRLLPRDLDLEGVFGWYGNSACEPQIEDSVRSCTMCRNICRNFPLAAVLKLRGIREEKYGFIDRGHVCISDMDRIKIMQTRPGAAALFQSSLGAKYLLDALDINEQLVHYNSEGKEFITRMEQLGAIPRTRVYSISDKSLTYVENLVALGFNPRIVSKADVYKHVARNTREMWDRATFDRLTALGFALDAKDFVLIDKSDVPLLPLE